MITEEMLVNIEKGFSAGGETGWDLPIRFFILSENGRLGHLGLPMWIYDDYPNPVELINMLAENQREELKLLQTIGVPYTEAHPEQAANGRAVGLIAVFESYGMLGPTYEAAIASLTDTERDALIAEYGRIPMSHFKDAVEQRNVMAVDDDLVFCLLTRYRKTDKLLFITERDAGWNSYGPMNDAMVSLFGAFKA